MIVPKKKIKRKKKIKDRWLWLGKAYIHQHYSMAHNIELKNHSHTNARVQSWLSMSSTTYLKRIIIFQTLRNKRKIFFKKKKEEEILLLENVGQRDSSLSLNQPNWIPKDMLVLGIWIFLAWKNSSSSAVAPTIEKFTLWRGSVVSRYGCINGRPRNPAGKK